MSALHPTAAEERTSQIVSLVPCVDGTSRSTISSTSVRLQRLRSACRSGAQLIPSSRRVMAWPVLRHACLSDRYSIHFERGPPCQENEVEGEIESQIDIPRSPRRAGRAAPPKRRKVPVSISGAGSCCNGSSRPRRQHEPPQRIKAAAEQRRSDLDAARQEVGPKLEAAAEKAKRDGAKSAAAVRRQTKALRSSTCLLRKARREATVASRSRASTGLPPRDGVLR